MITPTEIKLGLIVLAFLGTGAGGFAMGHRWEKVALEQEKVAGLQANAKATAEAVTEQKRLDGIALDAAKKDNVKQAALAALRSRQLAEVKKHVSDTRTRIPYGVVRLLDSAAGGVLADTLLLPAGKSDDAFTDLGWDDLARSVGGNYAKCRATFESRDALIQSFRASRK